MRSIWENVAQRVYENDVTQGISAYSTPRVGPEEPRMPVGPTSLVRSTTDMESPSEVTSPSLGTPTSPLRKKKSGKLESSLSVAAVDTEPASREGWKPLSLSMPILICLAIFTLLIAAGIETIAQRSKTQGGLALSSSIDAIPNYARLAYLYVPTLVAVIYSILWNWIDLDVKRMQPWFELSKTTGAQAKNSLFLDYRYDFIPIVPIYAARRKQWPVFCSGLAVLIVLWLITPLQGAILGTSSVEKSESATITTRSELQPLTEQVDTLDPEFLNTGYAIGWLNQSFPAFTTSEYALLPFYLQDDPTPKNIESNWTATTTKLTTDLNCWSAEVERTWPYTETSYNFISGKGCNATVSFYASSNYSMYYIGYHTSAYSDYWLAGKYCAESSTNSAHQFLAIWAKTIPVKGSVTPHFNITALYCEPSYYKQDVVATVQSSDFEPVNDSIQASSDRKTLSEDEFNSTAFEYVLGNGMAANPIATDYPFDQVVDQSTRLSDTDLMLPVSNMVGFALAGRDQPIRDYRDEELLARVYREAHQYLFSAAVSQLLLNSTEISNSTASVEYILWGIVASRAWATTVESLLLAVACITVALLWLCRMAPSCLPVNPISLRRHAELFRGSPELLDSFRTMDNADEEALFRGFEHDTCRLINNSHLSQPEVLLGRDISEASHPKDSKTNNQKGYYKPVKPLALRRESGVLFIACLIGIVIGLAYLKRQETVHDGLTRPSNNFEVLQLLENYIPTILATLIEPFWVLLNRMLCVLQPFVELWEGKAKASRSIDASYTSIPPQLVLWRALESRHYVLVLLCAVSFLANLLAIGLGSLFNEDVVTTTHVHYFQPSIAPRFDNESVYTFRHYLFDNLITSTIYQDPMYIVMANISSGTTLPAWISHEYYFQAHDLTTSDSVGIDDYYTLRTRGFGVNANCSSVPSSVIPTNTTMNDTDSGDSCASLLGTAKERLRGTGITRCSGKAAVEYSETLSGPTGTEICDLPLTLGWGRTPEGSNATAHLEASFAICRPFFQTAMFNITVDRDGKVLSYNRTTELKQTLDYDNSKDHTQILLENMNYQWTQQGFEYHNTTLTYDWMSYLLVLLRGTRSLLDANEPVPDPDEWIPTIEEVYRRTFVALLGLNEQLFAQADHISATETTRHSQETRIFMEEASFIITMTVLAIDIIVALIFYSRAVTFVLPRMPTTLGSIIAYFASSRIARSEYDSIPGAASRTFSFGRCIAYDGKVQLGIDMDPHVVPVEASSLIHKKGFIHRLGIGKAKEKQNQTLEGTWL